VPQLRQTEREQTGDQKSQPARVRKEKPSFATQSADKRTSIDAAGMSAKRQNRPVQSQQTA
jgi:hypothetical protein